jgi:hypothetical protein
MRTSLATLAAALAVGVFAFPAFGKTDAKDTKKGKDVAQVHWAHTYAAAIDEAQDRGAVIFATFHIDH